MSAQPCHQNAEEPFPVLSLKRREQQPPNPLLRQDKDFYRLLGALPKRSWLKRLRRLGLEGLAPLWRRVNATSPAAQSRWQWPWLWDDAVFPKYGAP